MGWPKLGVWAVLLLACCLVWTLIILGAIVLAGVLSAAAA